MTGWWDLVQPDEGAKTGAHLAGAWRYCSRFGRCWPVVAMLPPPCHGLGKMREVHRGDELEGCGVTNNTSHRNNNSPRETSNDIDSTDGSSFVWPILIFIANGCRDARQRWACWFPHAEIAASGSTLRYPHHPRRRLWRKPFHEKEST